jgi:hypothetical protein
VGKNVTHGYGLTQRVSQVSEFERAAKHQRQLARGFSNKVFRLAQTSATRSKTFPFQTIGKLTPKRIRSPLLQEVLNANTNPEPDLDLPSLLHTCCNPAAMRVARCGKHGRGGQTPPTVGDRIDKVSPPVRVGNYGQPQELSYTEKARGSSPLAPTKHTERVVNYLCMLFIGNDLVHASEAVLMTLP